MTRRVKKLSIHERLGRIVASGWKAGAKASAITLSASGGLIGVLNATGFSFAMWQLGAALGGGLIIGVLHTISSGGGSLLPMALCEQMSVDGAYTARFCTEEELREANDWCAPYYGDESVPSDLALQWRLKNRKAFVSIFNSRGELCASFGMLALREEVGDAHRRGLVLDSELSSQDILGLTATRSNARVYISGVVVRDARTLIGMKRASIMLWAMLRYVKDVLGLVRERELYAIAVSPDSHRLLVNMGFTVAIAGKHRRDRCDLYNFHLSKASWKTLLSRIGDLSPMCAVEFHRNDK